MPVATPWHCRTPYKQKQLTLLGAGALDFAHFSLYDTLYMAGALGAVAATGQLYHSLYASDPGWVLAGGRAEAPSRPMCQYCGVRPPLRSRHCFLTGKRT